MKSGGLKKRLLRLLWGLIPWGIFACIVVFIIMMGGKIKEEQTRLAVAKESAMKKDIPSTKVITLTLEPHRMEDKISLPGEVEPFEDLWVKAEVTGQVMKIFVKEGQYVKKGQVLVQIDDRDYRSRLARIEANPFPPRLVGPVEAMFESLAPHVGQPERFVFENLWLTAPLVARNMADQRLTLPFVKTTTALTMFNAGVKENVVPQRAEAKVNFRLLPGDTPESVLERIEEIVDDPQVDISYQRWQNIPPVSDHEDPGFVAISEAVREVYPEAVVVPSLLVATTDTRHYIDLADDQYRFHGMLLESSQASSVHGSDEYIAIDSYLNTIAIARHAMRLGAR